MGQKERGDFMKDIRTRVGRILLDICGEPQVRRDPALDLIGTGLMDSLSFIELLAALEDTFGVVIEPSQITWEELGTPEKIAALVEKRLGR